MRTYDVNKFANAALLMRLTHRKSDKKDAFHKWQFWIELPLEIRALIN